MRVRTCRRCIRAQDCILVNFFTDSLYKEQLGQEESIEDSSLGPTQGLLKLAGVTVDMAVAIAWKLQSVRWRTMEVFRAELLEEWQKSVGNFRLCRQGVLSKVLTAVKLNPPKWPSSL